MLVSIVFKKRITCFIVMILNTNLQVLCAIHWVLTFNCNRLTLLYSISKDVKRKLFPRGHKVINFYLDRHNFIRYSNVLNIQPNLAELPQHLQAYFITKIGWERVFMETLPFLLKRDTFA